jgi:DNA-binding transcriptional LysR family regulator
LIVLILGILIIYVNNIIAITLYILSMITMELRHLRYFRAVAESLSFSRAAEALDIAQPPLSQQIKALEGELNVQLFNRSTHPIQLTIAGQTFLQEARTILLQVDQATRATQQIDRGYSGKLTLGIHNSFANTQLPRKVAQFHQQFPDVRLEFREVTVAQELELLQNHQVDVVFHRSATVDLDQTNFNYLPLFAEDFVLVLPENHSLTALVTVPLAALKGESLILPDLDLLPFYHQVIDACRQSGFEPKLDLSIRSGGLVTLLSLVASGMGLSVMPAHTQVLHREGVVHRPIQGLQMKRHLALVWLNNDNSPILNNFVNFFHADQI